jgi:hypothetical protein
VSADLGVAREVTLSPHRLRDPACFGPKWASMAGTRVALPLGTPEWTGTQESKKMKTFSKWLTISAVLALGATSAFASDATADREAVERSRRAPAASTQAERQAPRPDERPSREVADCCAAMRGVTANPGPVFTDVG